MFKTFFIAAVSAVSIESASYQPMTVPTATTTTGPAAATVLDADVRDREAQVESKTDDDTDGE
jgi:hypothetical protein